MINAAIYGLGSWGQTLVNSVQGKSEKIQFVTGITTTIEKSENFAKDVGISLTHDYRSVLTDHTIDAVILATPHSLHADQVKQVAAAGKHVFVEKPFTLTKVSAEEAMHACINANVVLAVGFNRRFLPAFIEMKKMIEDGKIGDILHIETQSSGPAGYRRHPDSWRATRSENPGGGMAARGIHSIDSMIHLCGEIHSVYAMSERRIVPFNVDDTTSMLFQFKNGATGYLATIMATGNFWRTHVFGSRGWIEMQGNHSLIVSDLDHVVDSLQFDSIDIERAELEAFADTISGGKPFVVTPMEAIHSTRVLEVVDESAKTNTRVEVR